MRLESIILRLKFLSTSSARRTTTHLPVLLTVKGISIHVLREEDDHAHDAENDGPVKFLSTSSARRTTWPAADGAQITQYFYPRPPRGGRLHAAPPYLSGPLFLSTSSARRTTQSASYFTRPFAQFLSTSSARRTTINISITVPPSGDFYPRPPRGGRRPAHL